MRGKTSKKQTKAVRRFVLRSAAALLLAALHAGCANSGNGIITASATALTTTSPAVASVTDPIARSVQVASIAACAQKWGLDFDAVKLRAAYLAYEAKHGAVPAEIGKSYDATLRDITARTGAHPIYCAGKDGEQIKADLKRYLSGYFSPRANTIAEEPLEPKKFWKDQDDN